MSTGTAPRTAPRRVDAVIFDLDGTLTRPYLDFDAIRAEIGIAGREPVLEAMKRMNAAQRTAAELIVARHEADAAANSVLYDGVHDTLDALRRCGLPIALQTRNSRVSVMTVIERHALRFDIIRTREDGEIKPSPAPVLAICAQLGVAPAHVLSVGDFLFDIQCGAAAGAMTALMIGDAEPPPFADQADFVIRRLDELLDIVGRRETATPSTGANSAS